MKTGMIDAEPAPVPFTLEKAAIVMIDMQRDFLEPGGFGESLGNDVSKLRTAIAPCELLLEAAREVGMLVIHTREGHRPDMTDLFNNKFIKNPVGMRIGDPSPMGRILIRGEAGHDLIPELYPKANEPVVDKPGKGAFYATDLDTLLRNKGIEVLARVWRRIRRREAVQERQKSHAEVVCGVTSEVCVHTTVREANDRGYTCVVPSDACASFFPEFHATAMKMIVAQGGIFGAVSDAAKVAAAVRAAGSTTNGKDVAAVA